MVTVAGHWEIGYNTPIIEAYQWEFPILEWEVDRWLMCPVSGIRKHNPNLDLTEFHNYDEMLQFCGRLTRVFLEPRTKHDNPETIWLDDFQHPEDCVYVFGSAHKNPTLGYKREEDSVVTIKTQIDRGGLWPSQCLCLVMDDRRKKKWLSQQ
jgi:hypothetical protein